MGLWLPGDVLVSAISAGGEGRIYAYDPTDGTERGFIVVPDVRGGGGQMVQLQSRNGLCYGGSADAILASAGVDNDAVAVIIADGSPAFPLLTGNWIDDAGHFYYYQTNASVPEFVELDGSFSVVARHSYSDSDPNLPAGGRADAAQLTRNGDIIYWSTVGDTIGLLARDAVDFFGRYDAGTDSMLTPIDLTGAMAFSPSFGDQWAGFTQDMSGNLYQLVQYGDEGTNEIHILVCDSTGGAVTDIPTGNLDEVDVVALSEDESKIFTLWSANEVRRFANPAGTLEATWAVGPEGGTCYGLCVARGATSAPPVAGTKLFVAAV